MSVEALLRSRFGWFRLGDAATAADREQILEYATPKLGVGGQSQPGGVDKRMYHPAFCYLGVGLTFFITYLVFSRTQLDSNVYFYLPIALLISFYTFVSVLTDRQVYLNRNSLHAVEKAVPKYLFWGVVLFLAHRFYSVHPFYLQATPNTRTLLRHFIYAYIACGFPYFFLEEKFRACTDNFLADPYLRFAAILKSVWNLDFSRLKRRVFNKRNRRTVLSWAIRMHYMPIMIEQVHDRLNSLDWENLFYSHSLPYVTFLVATFAWMIDSNNASIGYFWQSTFTKSRFRDVDPHPSHWIIVLACYYPFIDFVGYRFVPFPDIDFNSTRYFASLTVNNVIDIAVLVALVGYMLSGTSLAFSYSNLCYKKIQTRGAYGIVRHPCTTCKMIFFTLSFYRFADAHTGRWFVCYLFWMSIYIGRALVEERFLKRFGEYREYMKKTRYRFFPRIA